MDPIALSAITWDEFETFPEFLASRRGKLGVNLACYVGHSNLRRWVMGADASDRAATRRRDRRRCGRWSPRRWPRAPPGVSSSAAPTHLDLDDRPVPSRVADRDELAALAEEAGPAGAGSIAYLPASAIGGLDARPTRTTSSSSVAVSGLPVVIQGLGGRNKVDAPTATWEAAQAFLDRATEAGAPVYSMLIARPFDRPVVIDETNFHYLAVPSWDRMLKLPHAERVALLRDPSARAELRDAVEHYNRDPAQGHDGAAAAVGRACSSTRCAQPEHEKFQVAVDRATSPTSAASRPPTRCSTSRSPRTSPPSSGGARRARSGPTAVGEAQLDARMIVGTSDGGAHLARDDGADWSSYFLRSWVLDRKVWTLEEGIRQITQVPAALLGLTDRGTIAPGRLGRPDGVRSRHDRAVEEGVRPRPARRRRPVQGVGPGRARDDRQRRADRARRRAHRRAPRPRRAAGRASVLILDPAPAAGGPVAAVDVHGRAGDEARQVAGEEHRDRGGVVGVAHEAERRHDGGVVVGARGEHLGAGRRLRRWSGWRRGRSRSRGCRAARARAPGCG